MNNKISAVVLVKNNAQKIRRIYDMLKIFDEIVIIDDNSTDDTQELCAKFNIKYKKHALNGDFSLHRNFALDQTNNEWVLFLDSDEEVNQDFVKDVMNTVKYGSYDGIYITRKVKFLGHIMTGTEMGKDKVLRLGKRAKGKWHRKVHEYWSIKGNVGILNTFILHNTAESIGQFIDKLTLYHKIHSEENIRSGKSVNFINIIIFTPYKLFYNYLILKGYKDGIFGLVAAVFMSFHTFLSWSNSWLISRK